MITLKPAIQKDDPNAVSLYANIVMQNKLSQYMKQAMKYVGKCVQKGNDHCIYIAAVYLIDVYTESIFPSGTFAKDKVFTSVEDFLSEGVETSLTTSCSFPAQQHSNSSEDLLQS